MFNRRTFVIATGAGALAAGYAVEQVVNSQHAAAAAESVDSMADMPGMAMPAAGTSTTSSFSYQGHAVELTESHSLAALTIDGRHPIHLTRPETGTYYTHLLPFTLYNDPKLLARDVVECARRGLFVV